MKTICPLKFKEAIEAIRGSGYGLGGSTRLRGTAYEVPEVPTLLPTDG